MSARTTGRSAGALFLLAYVVYLAGSALARSGSAGTVARPQIAAHQLQVSAGALLMLANSAAVIAIGILLFPVRSATTSSPLWLPGRPGGPGAHAGRGRRL